MANENGETKLNVPMTLLGLFVFGILPMHLLQTGTSFLDWVVCGFAGIGFVLVVVFLSGCVECTVSYDDRDSKSSRKKFRVRLAERRQRRAAKARHVLGKTAATERQNRRDPAD